MKELNNSSIGLNTAVSGLNQQVLGVSQGNVTKTSSKTKGYLRFTTFANSCADKDVLVKFKDPMNAASGLRAANVGDDGFFGCDIIGPIFRCRATKDINNSVRKDFVRSIIDSFEGAGDFNLFLLSEHDLKELKLKDFIGKAKLAEAREKGRLTLRDLLKEDLVMTGKPLSARRITAIADVFTRFESSADPKLKGQVKTGAKPKLEGQAACECLKNLFLGSLIFTGENAWKQEASGNLLKVGAYDGDGRTVNLTIRFADQDAGDQQGAQEVGTDNEAELTKLKPLNGTHRQFLCKMLSLVSWYGVDVFSYENVPECDKAGVKPHGGVSINLTIKRGAKLGTKEEAKDVTLVVSEAGDDARTACTRTVKFTIPEDFFRGGTPFESVEIADS